MAKSNQKHSDPDNSEADNVDKIRDILFGNQMREFGQKFANLEQSLAKDLAAIRKENMLQIESVKSFIESEIEILGLKLADIDDIDGQLKQNVTQIEKKISDVLKLQEKNSRDINQKILKQSQDFSSEMNFQINEARERMDSHKQELSKVKVDKSALSEMLNALALQINSDE